MKITLQAMHNGTLRRNTYQGFTMEEAVKHFQEHVANVPEHDIQVL